MMKSLLLATTVVAAFAAAPAMAQEAPIGSVGVTYTNNSIDIGIADEDAETWSVDGVVAMPAFGDWTVTLAGDIGTTEFLGDEDTAAAGSVGLSRMFGSDTRFGGFVGASDAGDETAWTVGARAQKYLAGATLTGSLAWTTLDDADIDVWTVGADAAFYVSPNLRLNAGVSFDTIDDADVDAWTYGVGAEYDIASTPFSVTAGYARSDIEDIDVDTFSVGLRYSFGGGLQARDRAGAGASTSGIAGLLGIL